METEPKPRAPSASCPHQTLHWQQQEADVTLGNSLPCTSCESGTGWGEVTDGSTLDSCFKHVLLSHFQRRENNAACGPSIDISLLLFVVFWSAVISVRARKYPVSNLIRQNVHQKSNSCVSFAFLQSFLLASFSMTSFSLHTEENKNDHNDVTFL